MLLNLIYFIVMFVLVVSLFYFSLNVVDRLTSKLEEWEEIKKGNVAVGIYVSSVVLTFFIMISSELDRVFSVYGIDSLSSLLVYASLSFVQLFLSFLFAALSVFISLVVIDRTTTDVDEFEELRKGNVAVALLMSTVVISIGFLLSFLLKNVFVYLDPFSLVVMYG